MGKLGFTPIIGLAVVVALALAAVFGAMSLANPALADIEGGRDAPTAMAITSAGITLGDPKTRAEDAETDDPYEFEDDTYTLDNFAGKGPVTGGDAGPTYVVDFLLSGEFTASDRILIELPDGAVIPGDYQAAGVTVTDQDRATDAVEGVRAPLATTTYAYPETLTGVNREDGDVPDTRYIIIDLTTARADDADDQKVRVTIPGMTNPEVHGPNPINIYHYMIDPDGNGDYEDNDVSMESADLDIETVMAMQDRSGNYVITFFAQDDYDTGDDLVITMPRFGMPASILKEDVEVGVLVALDGAYKDELSPAREVTVDRRASTITIEVPRPGFDEGEVVEVIIYDDAGIDAPADGLYQIEVGDASSAGDDGIRIGEAPDPAEEEDEVDEATDPMFIADSSTGGSVARYQFDFNIPDPTNTLIHDLVIELEDFTVPSSIRTASVTITSGGYTFTPEDVAVDGEEIFISIGDVTEDVGTGGTSETVRGGVYTVGGADGNMTVVLRKSAGISNPTEAGGFPAVITFDELKITTPEVAVVRKVSLDEEDGGLGDVITATGKGFKDGTTLTVFLDQLADHDDDSDTPMTRNRKLDLGEDVLCVVPKIGGNDAGSCEFTITHPTFSGGPNYINAVDGRSNTALESDMFTLKASISASPPGGSPGEIIQIQVVDFPRSRSISRVEIARDPLNCGGCGGTIDVAGAGNFSITIPNSVKAGTQELRVVTVGDDGEDVTASTNIDLLGPQINVTPGSVLANQRVSLVGTGFSPGSVIANADDPLKVADPEISIGGKMILGTRINDGDPVRVDNGGNWSASVDLPLAEATTAEGERALRVSDSRGRTGGVVVDIPAREVTVTPEAGRVGTIAVVRGTGFPSKNDEGSSFNIQIVYDASNGNTSTVSAAPDASGRFETQLRIPTTAAIPSSNSIKVSFRDEEGVLVPITVPHEVPEGIINLSQTSGGPGSTITINGEGFKSFVPISLVKVGTLDVTPAPKPSTDGNGMMSFDILIPGLDVGIQTIEVEVGRTTSSTGFTVTESGDQPRRHPGSRVRALEDLGDNFENIWHFNNDTKAWSFYDGHGGQ